MHSSPGTPSSIHSSAGVGLWPPLHASTVHNCFTNNTDVIQRLRHETGLTGVFLFASTTARSSPALLGWNCGYSFFSNVRKNRTLETTLPSFKLTRAPSFSRSCTVYCTPLRLRFSLPRTVAREMDLPQLRRGCSASWCVLLRRNLTSVPWLNC